MQELSFMESSADLTADDKKEFDYYVTQFAASLIDVNSAEDNYWHGRLIGLGYEVSAAKLSEYLINFLGESYSEKRFRRALVNGALHISSFEILPDQPLEYRMPKETEEKPDSDNNVDSRIITYRARIVYSINNGASRTDEVTITHHLRRTYLAYKTVIY